MQLSKSDYMLFLKHPAWLWLKKHDKYKLPPIDPNTQAMFDAGHLFETIAEQLFENSIKLGFDNYDDYLALPDKTISAIAENHNIILQGRFEKDSLTCICDAIEIIDQTTIDLYEIKSSTRVKIEHYYDLCFQMIVLESLGYKVRNISVIHVNNKFVKNGPINPTDIAITVDVTEKVRKLTMTTNHHIKKALDVMSSLKCPDISPVHCRLGSLSEWLDIYKKLSPVDQNSIYDLYLLNVPLIAKFNSSHIEKLSQIPDDFPLAEKQLRQLNSFKLNQPIINLAKIKKFLDSLSFPLYFLDYETLASVIPSFDGLRPYQQLPFQYSLHILDKPNGKLKHFEYLHTSNDNPAKYVVDNLKNQIQDKGSILTWNMSFEKNCNLLLATYSADSKPFINDINSRIQDLMIPFSEGYYIDSAFKGSASLKNVLPVIVPELSYKDLEIAEGGSAQRLWMEAVLDDKRPDQKQQILDNLLIYCKLDTLAMVEIYNFLSNLK